LKPYLAVIVVAAGLCGLCGAQTLAVGRNTLTNRGVVTLAKAGFNEEFIIDAILSSRTQFDTSVNGLAELAREGITERLIRVMMNPIHNAPAASGAGIAAESALTMPFAPPKRPRPKIQVLKPSPVRMAIADRTPYYQSTSHFFGLWKTKIEVGPGPEIVDPIAPHLGVLFDNVRLPRPYIPIGGAAQDYLSFPIAPQYARYTQPAER
jgi:hypothetical protein